METVEQQVESPKLRRGITTNVWAKGGLMDIWRTTDKYAGWSEQQVEILKMVEASSKDSHGRVMWKAAFRDHPDWEGILIHPGEDRNKLYRWSSAIRGTIFGSRNPKPRPGRKKMTQSEAASAAGTARWAKHRQAVAEIEQQVIVDNGAPANQAQPYAPKFCPECGESLVFMKAAKRLQARLG